MGAVSGALAAAATGFGAEITTNAEVYAIDPDGEVCYTLDGEEHRVRAEHILSGVTPAVLAGLVGDPAPTVAPGAQVKVNLLLRRLPRLRDETVTPEQAFGGTFHINENYSQLDAAYQRAAGGTIPDPLPCEIYCHSLTDPSHPVRRAPGSGRADADGVRPARPAHPGDRRGSRPAARGSDLGCAAFAEFGSGRTDSGCADGGRDPVGCASRPRPPWIWNGRWA